MTIGRRTFLRHSALVGAMSALASFLSLSSIVSQAEITPGLVVTAIGCGRNRLEFG